MIKLDNTKSAKEQVKITGRVEFEGTMRDIEIVKFDMKNNVVGFNVEAFGKKVYIGASADAPKLSDIQDITFTFAE